MDLMNHWTGVIEEDDDVVEDANARGAEAEAWEGEEKSALPLPALCRASV